MKNRVTESLECVNSILSVTFFQMSKLSVIFSREQNIWIFKHRHHHHHHHHHHHRRRRRRRRRRRINCKV
jgi:hypothetical protein